MRQVHVHQLHCPPMAPTEGEREREHLLPQGRAIKRDEDVRDQMHRLSPWNASARAVPPG